MLASQTKSKCNYFCKIHAMDCGGFSGHGLLHDVMSNLVRTVEKIAPRAIGKIARFGKIFSMPESFAELIQFMFDHRFCAPYISNGSFVMIG